MTESQAVAAGLCFVVMLVNYFLSDLAGFASSTAYSSLAALAVTALIVCGIVYLMTKNGFVSLILAAVLDPQGSSRAIFGIPAGSRGCSRRSSPS